MLANVVAGQHLNGVVKNIINRFYCVFLAVCFCCWYCSCYCCCYCCCCCCYVVASRNIL